MTKLVAQDLSKEFPTRAEPLRVLQDVSLELATGQNVAIIGPSGCGKSTLLFSLGTLDPPTSGTITLDGVNPYELTAGELADFRNEKVGFVFQDHHLLPQLSVLENVLMPVLASGLITSDAERRAHELLDRVGLSARKEHRPAELSGGERGRVAIAGALVRSPQLILADEPTGSLDRRTAQQVVDVLLKLQQQESMMLVVVTHSRALAEQLDRCFELVDGRLQPLEDNLASS